MTILHERPKTTDIPPADAEILIREARRLRRRRWMFGSIVVALALVGMTVYVVSSPPSGGKSTGRTNSNQHPYLAGTAPGTSDIAADSPDLLQPESIAVEPNGNLLIADGGRNQIFERNQRGQLKLIAGTGEDGFGGDGGSATHAALGTISGIALSPSGTLYVAESDFGSPPCRLRAIADGRIRTVTTDCIGSLQIGPNGAPYGSYGPGIYQINADGHLALVAGGPTKLYPQVPADSYHGSDVPLVVDSFAFERDGDLIVYDFGNYQIDRITRSGVFSEIEGGIGAGRAAQLATLPDGSVLVAMDGGLFQLIAPNALSGGTFRGNLPKGAQGIYPRGVDGDYFNVGPTQVTGFHGAAGDWFLGGLAIAPSGTIYLAGNNQADFNVPNKAIDATVLFKISPSRHASALPITTPLRATLPVVGAKGFPASLYPAQVRSSASGLSSCPNLAGLEPFDQKARAAIVGMFTPLMGGSEGSFYESLKIADRSWWPGLFEMWQEIHPPLDGASSIESVAPAASDALAPMIAQACGAPLVKESLVVSFGRTGRFFVLDRGGHPLAYLQGS